VKKSVAVPPVMLSHAGRVTKHLDPAMTYVMSRFFASLGMRGGRDFFATSAVPYLFTRPRSVYSCLVMATDILVVSPLSLVADEKGGFMSRSTWIKVERCV